MKNIDLELAKLEASLIKKHISKGEHANAKRHCDNIMSIGIQNCICCAWWTDELCTIKYKLEKFPSIKSIEWKPYPKMVAVVEQSVSTLYDSIIGKKVTDYNFRDNIEEGEILLIIYKVLIMQCHLNVKQPKDVNKCTLFTINPARKISTIKEFGIPLKGTMAHSFVTSFPTPSNELYNWRSVGIEGLKTFPLYLLIMGIRNKLVYILKDQPKDTNKQYTKDLETLREQLDNIQKYF